MPLTLNDFIETVLYPRATGVFWNSFDGQPVTIAVGTPLDSSLFPSNFNSGNPSIILNSSNVGGFQGQDGLFLAVNSILDVIARFSKITFVAVDPHDAFASANASIVFWTSTGLPSQTLGLTTDANEPGLERIFLNSNQLDFTIPGSVGGAKTY